MADYFSPRKRNPSSLLNDLLSTHEHNQELQFKQSSNEPLYHSALAFGTGFLSDVNLIVYDDGGGREGTGTKKSQSLAATSGSGSIFDKNGKNESASASASASAPPPPSAQLAPATRPVGNQSTAPESSSSFKVFKCHKLILSMNSVIFHTMFHGSLPEPSDVHIHDSDPNSFQVFLQYIYAGLFPTNLPLTELFPLLYLATKYQISKLQSLITDKLGRMIKPSNTLQLLKVANLYELTWLRGVCWLHIEFFPGDILQGPDWLGLDKQTLELILGNAEMDIDEVDLFERTVEWAKAEWSRRRRRASTDAEECSPTPADLRQILGSALYLFAFPTLTASQLADGPAATGILSDKELVTLFMYICSTAGGSRSPPLTCPLFPCFKRCLAPGAVPGFSSSSRGVKPELLEECRRRSSSSIPICKCTLEKTPCCFAITPITPRPSCFFCYCVAPYRKFKSAENCTRCPGESPGIVSLIRIGLTLFERSIHSRTPAVYCECRTNNYCPAATELLVEPTTAAAGQAAGVRRKQHQHQQQ